MVKPGFSGLENSSDLQEFQTVLSQTLTSFGITVEIAQEKAATYILLESQQIPDQREILNVIHQSLATRKKKLNQILRIYGRQIGDSFTTWVGEIHLLETENVEVKDNLSKIKYLVKETQIRDREEHSYYQNKIELIEQKNRSSHSALTQSLPTSRVDYFIVCGLGRLGQHCVMSLKSFALQNLEIRVTAIDRQQPSNWEVDHLTELLNEEIIMGDCRQDAILKQAGIEQCRAILIVTQDENANIETAIAARRLNPAVRLIVRSGKQNLNELLKQRLGNFAAFEPIELPAESFVLSALGEEVLGLVKVGDRQLRVIQHQVKAGDDRFDNLPVHKLYKDTFRLLKYVPALNSAQVPSSIRQPLVPEPFSSDAFKFSDQLFYQWHPDTHIQPGDTLFYLETAEQQTVSQPSENSCQRFKRWHRVKKLLRGNWRQTRTQIWTWVNAERTRQVSSLGLLIAFCLGVFGAVLLKLTVNGITWQAAISSAVILLLGGYGDVFGGLDSVPPIPWWVQVICLFITATSLLFVLSVLGLLADRLLSTRFEFLKPRPPVPQANHIVLVGLGRVGRRIATLLQEFRQPFVCLTQSKEHEDFMPQVPLVCSPILQGLEAINLAQAKSVIVTMDDQMLNLEVALMARNAASQVDRTLNLVIRAQDQRFCDRLISLMPEAKALCVYALTAEAFAGAAFGENILSLFRLENQTILVTEYRIEAEDTLNSKLLAQVAYGYDVVPIAYQAQTDNQIKVMPSDNVRLQEGDRLIVLATINGLQRIEWGVLASPRRWQLQALKPLNPGVTFYAGNTLENISGCPLSKARAFMDNLPETLAVPGVMELALYDHQADHLLRKLRKLLPVRLIPID